MKQKLFFRKMLAMLSSVLILLSLMIMPAAADTNMIIVPDEIAAASMKLLSGLGLAEPAEKFDNGISRGDFAQLLANMMRYENFGAPDSGYRDLSGNVDAINFCIEQGYMSGDKGLFRPADAITYAEAAKALVEMTGINYANTISTTSGYMSRASSLGISRGIVGGANDPVSVGAAFKMLANTLKVDSIKMSAISTEGYYSDITKGKFMENMLHIEKVTGLLTRTKHTGIYTANGLGAKQVEIDDVIYQVNKDWSEFLGCYVEAYVDCHEDTPILLYMAVSDANETLELTAKDIVGIDASYVLTYYEDEEENETNTIRLARETTVIYNGRNAGSILNFTNNELQLKTEDGKEKNGSIRLLDSDSDGTCDVMVITAYEIMHVFMADKVNKTIIDKNITTPLDLSMIRDEDIHVMYESGTEGDFSVLAAEQVLSIAKSRDNKLVTIIISENVLEEVTVSGVRDSEYLIDGIWYKTNPYYDTYYASRQDDGLRMGWSGTVKLDLDGRITAPANSTNLTYGYLIGISDPIGLDSNIQVKMFSKEGGHEILDMATKVSVNHTPYKEEAVKALAVFKNGSSFRDQMVRFSTNDMGEINGIITADRSDIKTAVDTFSISNTSWYNDGYKEFMLNFEGSLKYKHTGLYSNKFMYPTSSDLWVIPNDLSNEKGFVVSNSLTQFSNDATYTVQLYNVNAYGVPEIVVSRTDSVSSTFARDNRLLVTDVVKAANDDGEVVYKITGQRRNTTGTAYIQTTTITTGSLDVIDTELTFDAGTFSAFAGTPDTDGVEPGDVIRYQNDTMGITTKVVTEFDYSSMIGNYATTRPTEFAEVTDAGSSTWCIHAPVVFSNKSCVALTLNGGSFFRTFQKSVTDQWIVWDPVEKTFTLEIEPALYGALQQGEVNSRTSHIFSVLGYGSTGFTVVYLREPIA